jgi:hypothetical protein
MKQAAARECLCHRAKTPWRSFAFAAVMSLTAAGCQFAGLEQLAHDSPICNARCDDWSTRLGREVNMNRRWQNHRLSELRSTLGQPQLLMSIPGGGNPPGFVAVYGQDALSGCLDAFAFVYGEDPIIRVYHCR